MIWNSVLRLIISLLFYGSSNSSTFLSAYYYFDRIMIPTILLTWHFRLSTDSFLLSIGLFPNISMVDDMTYLVIAILIILFLVFLVYLLLMQILAQLVYLELQLLVLFNELIQIWLLGWLVMWIQVRWVTYYWVHYIIQNNTRSLYNLIVLNSHKSENIIHYYKLMKYEAKRLLVLMQILVLTIIRCDLPVHCLAKDIRGEWTLFRSTDLKDIQ